MDFFAAQEQAQKKTRWLVFWFALAVLGFVAAVYLLFVLVSCALTYDERWIVVVMYVVLCLVIGGGIYGEKGEDDLATFLLLLVAAFIVLLYLIGWILGQPPAPLSPAKLQFIESYSPWSDPLPYCPALLAGIGMVAVSLYKMRQIARQGGFLIAEQLGGRIIGRNTTDPAERRLLHVIEEMAIAAGIPAPVAFVLPMESSLNAFAAGLSTQDSVIGVTRGLLDVMNRDELQGVIAHEISHIAHGDSRLNMKLVGILGGLYGLTLFARAMIKAMQERPRAMQGKGMGQALMMCVILNIAGSVSLFFGRLIQAAISREREYLADAAAVQFTRNPAGLASALNQLRVAGSQIQHPQALAASHLFFGASEKPARFWASRFATHPPLKERIRRLGGEALPLSEIKVAQAQTLLAAMPENLRQATTTVSGATSIVCGLFLSISEIKLMLLSRQKNLIPPAALPVANELKEWLHSQPQPEGARYRLVWLDLVLPTLRGATEDECRELLALVTTLIQATEHVYPSEIALYSILQNTLFPARRSGEQSALLWRQQNRSVFRLLWL
ncbi:MAG: M48 family metallopeptidase, partial [Zoogloeaceae bacterium]|nr:M48 family metallopeptidase [Zoogloeaceae bacterium]